MGSQIISVIFPIAFHPIPSHYAAMIALKNYFINTTNKLDVVSIIHEINRSIRESELPEGLVSVVVPAPGGAVTIIEPLPEIVNQLKEAVRVFPGEGVEIKNRRKEEIAIGPRVMAAMLGKSIQIPFKDGRLLIGPREEVVLLDFEESARRREFFVQVIGEKADQAQKSAPPRRK